MYKSLSLFQETNIWNSDINKNTRVSAQRGINNPSRPHFLIYKNNLSL